MLQTIISSSSAGKEQKDNAVSSLSNLFKTINSEIVLENQIFALGYNNCVIIYSTHIDIIIKHKQLLTQNDINQIISKTKQVLNVELDAIRITPI